MENNTVSLDTLCAALCYAMGIEPPAHAAPANQALCDYVDQALHGKKADRIVMYNPDAVGQWLQEKYPQLIKEVTACTELALPMRSVMPCVTPVCFGTMYTGAQPEVHGIQKYEKPVITIDTIFDAMLRAGKKCAIIADNDCSLARIYLNRDIDYYPFPIIRGIDPCAIADINAKTMELIMKDEYDFLVIYNGNYDTYMHKHGPEGLESLCELRANSQAFAQLNAMIKNHWAKHDVLLGFAMDHGCHEIDGGCGSHGLDMPEDMDILHHYVAYPAAE